MTTDVSPAVEAPAAPEKTPAGIRRARDYRTRAQLRAVGEWKRKGPPPPPKGPASSLSAPAFTRARRLQERRLLAAAEKAILAMTPEQRAEFEKSLALAVEQRAQLAAARTGASAEVSP